MAVVVHLADRGRRPAPTALSALVYALAHQIGLREDVMSYLMGVPHELWVQEYEKWREASEERQDGLWEDIKRIWAMRVSRGTRTKRHAA
jgi:hypothetical protein